jgi:hypothetical protein
MHCSFITVCLVCLSIVLTRGHRHLQLVVSSIQRQLDSNSKLLTDVPGLTWRLHAHADAHKEPVPLIVLHMK